MARRCPTQQRRLGGTWGRLRYARLLYAGCKPNPHLPYSEKPVSCMTPADVVGCSLYEGVMHKPDEVALFERVSKECRNGYIKRYDGPCPIDIARDLGIPDKRAEALFEKWADQGIYEYGTTSLRGWVTPKGFEKGLP